MQDPCPTLSPRPRCAGTFAAMAATAVMASAALVSLLGLLSMPAWASSAVTDQAARWLSTQLKVPAERTRFTADLVAGRVAEALRAEKLILLTNKPGILDRAGTTLATLTAAEVEALVRDGTINEGMLPKTDCALEALRNGVRSVQIIDGTVAHSLLVEIFTDAGIGTKITLDAGG